MVSDMSKKPVDFSNKSKVNIAATSYKKQRKQKVTAYETLVSRTRDFHALDLVKRTLRL